VEIRVHVSRHTLHTVHTVCTGISGATFIIPCHYIMIIIDVKISTAEAHRAKKIRNIRKAIVRFGDYWLAE
jgi:hypothetical protein